MTLHPNQVVLQALHNWGPDPYGVYFTAGELDALTTAIRAQNELIRTLQERPDTAKAAMLKMMDELIALRNQVTMLKGIIKTLESERNRT